MPKPRCSAEFQERSCRGPILVGSNGFADGGLTKDGKRTYIPNPVTEYPAPCPGARPSRPPVAVDQFGRQFGGNWSAVEAAERMNCDGAADDLAGITVAGFFDDRLF